MAALEPGFTTPAATKSTVISGSVRQGVDGSIRPRIGYLINPWTMIYATGGIAFNHVSASYSYASTITYTNLAVNPSFSPQSAVDTLAGSGSVDKTLTGGTVGAGVEFIIGYGLKARLEYRWSGFSGVSFDVPLTRTCTGAGCTAVALPSTSGAAHIDIEERPSRPAPLGAWSRSRACRVSRGDCAYAVERAQQRSLQSADGPVTHTV
jgi:hypothetical protein